MPIYQRENGYWYIDIITASGKRIRRSAATKIKREAEELHDKIKHEQWSIKKLDRKPNVYWDEACIRWITEKADKKSLEDDKRKMKLLTAFRGKTLNSLNRDFIMQTITQLSCSNSTKNRYIALIRAVLRKCEREWEWIDKAPALSTFKEPKRRIRWLKKDEVERLLNCLPELLSDLAKFSLMTGLRQRNALLLEWSQIDLNTKVAWIYADRTKSGKNLGVPLNNWNNPSFN
ncbi:tyrosine-type recombinase/integrase [Snodgrassella sp. CFCC 13594]|uniref:tyrosine-type recombinase/integrase n=1 Tax=Snodgrassella sp. CFCC 13594 TaxID=1775559 RepID=UPI000A5EDAAD|nr:tyrosine-type recombinase/integrase [Snodgrassella sp. CFCC 13594]